MDSCRILLGLLLLMTLVSSTHSQYSLLRMKTDQKMYCDSWRYAIETNDAGTWSTVPEECFDFVEKYMEGERYRADSEVVADYAIAFAKYCVNVSGNGNKNDAWVFDIDETLLSNLPYYRDHGYFTEPFNETSFDLWVDSAVAPALPASLRLYNELIKLNFTIFLLTGRSEYQRNSTVKNLLYAGYSGWEKLFLRGPSDSGKLAIVYKSEKRKEIQSAGYTIQGSSGDQWSDLNGFAVATRSFKVPNPMYYVA